MNPFVAMMLAHGARSAFEKQKPQQQQPTLLDQLIMRPRAARVDQSVQPMPAPVQFSPSAPITGLSRHAMERLPSMLAGMRRRY